MKVSDHTLEIWTGGRRASSHRLFAANEKGKWSTNRGDVPPGHEWRSWDPARVGNWAARVGMNTLIVVGGILASHHTPDQGVEPALAVLRLSRRYGGVRLENACDVARRCITNVFRQIEVDAWGWCRFVGLPCSCLLIMPRGRACAAGP